MSDIPLETIEQELYRKQQELWDLCAMEILKALFKHTPVTSEKEEI